MSDLLRRAITRAVAILRGSYGGRRHRQELASGDARKLLEAALNGEDYPRTASEANADLSKPEPEEGGPPCA